MGNFKPLAALYAPYPLTDRITFYHDSQAAFLTGIFTGLAIPMVGVVGRKLGMGSGHFAFLNACMAVGFLFNIWSGHLAERGNRAALVFWPNLSARLAVGFAAFAGGSVGFTLAFGFFNFASALSHPAYSSIMRSNYSEENRGRLMGDIRILIQVTAAAAAAAAGWFLQTFPTSHRILFPIATAFGIAGSLAFYRIKPRVIPHRAPQVGVTSTKPSIRDSVRIITEDKPFLAYMAIFFLIGFPDKIVIAVEPIRLVDELGMDYASAGLIQGTLPFVAGILSFLFYSRALERIDPFRLLFLSVFLLSTRFAGIALATESAHLIPVAFVSALGSAGWDLLPLFTILRFSGPDRLALYLGVHMALIGLRSLLGPIIGSLLYESAGISLVHLYWLVFALQLLAIVALFLFLRRPLPPISR